MEDRDRISNLPDAIISHILSFLSTKEAGRTSILSTRWRYLFALVTNLDLELDDMLLQSRRKRKSSIIKSFESFVDRVMFVHNATNIEKFRLECFHSSHVCSWISAAVWRGAQHLDVNIIRPKFTTLPGVLFTCRTLVTLKLELNFVLDLPNYVCFPNLKTLHLISIGFLNDESIKRLLSSCICLEDMIMEECKLRNIRNLNVSHHSLKRLTIVRRHKLYRPFVTYSIEIDAPMLVYFKYANYEAAGYSLKNLHSLASADIDLVPVEDSINPHQVDATLFFRGICNVLSLNPSSTSMKLLLGCEPIPDFLNMVKLKIYQSSSSIRYYDPVQKGLVTLLEDSPELEELTFFQKAFNFSHLPLKVPFCLSFKLKAIEISGFEAKKDCIKKAKYVLKKARLLEKLTIRTRSFITEMVKQKISEELLASPRKSKQCCILII